MGNLKDGLSTYEFSCTSGTIAAATITSSSETSETTVNTTLTGSLIVPVISGTATSYINNVNCAGSVVATGILKTSSNLSVTGSIVGAGLALTADLTSTKNINLSAGSLTAAGGINVPGGIVNAQREKFSGGSPFYTGVVISSPLKCDAIISGGMWVAGSKTLVIPAKASCAAPIGVCVTTTASGGYPDILVKGLAYRRANSNVVYGDRLKMGAGAQLDGVAAMAGSPSVINEVGYCVGRAVGDAASGASAFALVSLV
jgi:hypothetical protein